MGYQGERERKMHWLVGRKENVQLVCVEIDMSGEAEQGHGKGLGRKQSSPGREMGRLVDGEVIGKKGSDKQAASTR